MLKWTLTNTTTIILQLFWTLSGTTRVSLYQKGKTRKENQSGFTGARDSEWQWHLLGRMQICTSPQTDNCASISPLIIYRPDALPATQPTVSKQEFCQKLHQLADRHVCASRVTIDSDGCGCMLGTMRAEYRQSTYGTWSPALLVSY